jgi:hypothetical protein
MTNDEADYLIDKHFTDKIIKESGEPIREVGDNPINYPDYFNGWIYKLVSGDSERIIKSTDFTQTCDSHIMTPSEYFKKLESDDRITVEWISSKPSRFKRLITWLKSCISK